MKFIGIKNKDLVYEIADKNGEYIIGRAENCDVVMKFKGVSAQHCKLFMRDNQIALLDMGSSNGTLVNGARIKRKMLHPKDIVQIGVEKFNVILSANAQEIPRKKRKPVQMVEPSGNIETSEKKQMSENEYYEDANIEEKAAKKPVLKPRKTVGMREKRAPQEKVSALPVKNASEKASKQESSGIWLIIFFVGGILGIALFVVGMIMKTGSDAEMQDLLKEISSIKRENTAIKSKINILRSKLSEITGGFVDLRTYVDKVANGTYQSQRDISTEVEDFKINRTQLIEDVRAIQMKLEKLQEDIESVNEK